MVIISPRELVFNCYLIFMIMHINLPSYEYSYITFRFCFLIKNFQHDHGGGGAGD